MKLVIAFCVVMVSGSAFAQHRTGGESFSGGAATPSGGSSGGSSSGGSVSSSSSSSGGETAQPIRGGMSMAVAHRTGSVSVPANSSSPNSSNGAFTNYSNLSAPVPEFARPRGSLPINMAIPRSSAPAPGDSGVVVISSYNPWLYAYDGLAVSPLYGVFDPFLLDYGFAPASTTTTPPADPKGVLHFKVKPRKAEVYIDGGLVGQANQFEGLFHRLRLDAGVHRVELRAPGYQPLVVNVRIQAGESITYRGELEKNAP